MASCRTCTRQDFGEQHQPSYDLFASDVRPKTKMLMDNTSLQIVHEDGLPERICGACFAQLAAFQEFCAQAIETDLLYRNSSVYVKCELIGEDNKIGFVRVDIPVPPALQTPTPSTPAAYADQKPAADLSDLIDGHDDSKVESLALSPNVANEHCNVDNDDNNAFMAAAADSPDDDSSSSSDSEDYSPDNTADQSKNPSTTTTDGGKPSRRPRRVTDKSVKYTCDMCGKYYWEKQRLAGHLRQHCGLQPFPCPDCPKEYDKYSKLLAHQKRSHAPGEPDEPTACPHEGCPKTYRQPRYAQDHYERIHLGLRPKVRAQCMCDTCGKSFMTRSSLQQHMRSHMDIEQYPYRCEVCDKRFLAKNGWQLHMLRHQNIRNFPCPLCPSRMVSQLELNYHVAKHDKSVPWPCPECTMVFQRKASLRRHELKVHRGYKPYVCSFCSRAFGKKLSLVNHERLHTGERPFACPICDRRFVQQVHMKAHTKTHNK